MVQMGLSHSHQPVKQFRDSPFLLAKRSLNEVQTTEKGTTQRSEIGL